MIIDNSKFIFNIVILTIGWILALYGHAVIVPNAKKPILIALFDPSVHGLIALLLALPFYFYNIIDFRVLAISVLLAVFIDIDHAIAAKSVDVSDMLKLSGRPITHSLLVNMILSFSFAFIVKEKFVEYQNYWLLVYLFFIGFSSHILRDATDAGGTPWAYPFNSFQINEYIYFSIYIFISYFHLLIGKLGFISAFKIN